MTLPRPDSPEPGHTDAPAIDFVARADEQALVRAVRSGDATAFETIFRCYHQELRAAAERLVESRATAEDVVQEVFLAVWAARARWHVTTSLGAYLHRSVRNVAMRRAASVAVRRHEPIVLADGVHGVARSGGGASWVALVEPGPSPLDRAEQGALMDDVARAAASLPPRAREVFTLSRAEQLSTREIAERLALSPKTVEMHLTRALAALRQVLARWRGA
jgi:RNA polymerase sigma-70 factor (ECF subfamily)